MLADFFHFLENKDRFIDANPNLTDEQKEELKKFFLKYPQYESKLGDWQKSKDWTWETFEPIIAFSKKGNFEKTATTIEGLKAGVDYRVILVTDKLAAYQPLTHKGSWVLASNAVGPAVWTPIPGWYSRENAKDDYIQSATDSSLWSGAKWCISMKHSPKYWNDYTKSNEIKFLFVMSNDNSVVPSKKVAITYYSPSRVELYNAADSNISNLHDSDYILKTYPEMGAAYKKWLQKLNPIGMEYIQELLDAGTIRKNGEYYDFFNTRNIKRERLFEEDGTCPIKIGRWAGDWVCSDIEDFKNSPRIIRGSFICKNLNLEDLEGCPEKVEGGIFDCSQNKLTSLKGLSQLDSWVTLVCNNNSLESLEGCPKSKIRSIICHNNKLKTLKGASSNVSYQLDCGYNELNSLEGPQSVGCLFAYNNNLQDLNKMPQVLDLLDIRDNNIDEEAAEKELQKHLSPKASVIM